jgi:hypothetical protein
VPILDRSTAIIPAEKLRDYLLSSAHPIGRYKAVLFQSLGDEQTHWELLESALRDSLSADAQEQEVTEYDCKYVIHARLTGPNGKSANFTAVWIIIAGETAARFVTAYPRE